VLLYRLLLGSLFSPRLEKPSVAQSPNTNDDHPNNSHQQPSNLIVHMAPPLSIFSTRFNRSGDKNHQDN
jgi:hypothetical protein